MERLADTRMRLCADLKECEYLLIGLGEEWKSRKEEALENLWNLFEVV